MYSRKTERVRAKDKGSEIGKYIIDYLVENQVI